MFNVTTPCLLAHAAADMLVPPVLAQLAGKILRSKGVPAVVVRAAGADSQLVALPSMVGEQDTRGMGIDSTPHSMRA